MNKLKALEAERSRLLAEIKKCERTHEDIENEQNIQLLEELNKKRKELEIQKQDLSAKLSAIQQKFIDINDNIHLYSKDYNLMGQLVCEEQDLQIKLTEIELQLQLQLTDIDTLSNSSIDRILYAIKKQRWFFFKNKPNVLMDKNTGMLWANLNYFRYCSCSFRQPNVDKAPRFRANEDSLYYITSSDVTNIISGYTVDGYSNWRLPNFNELQHISTNKAFPFYKSNLMLSMRYWLVQEGRLYLYSKDNGNLQDYSREGFFIPCNDSLVKGSNYASNVSENNSIYTEKERLQFTLDLFVKNNLLPIFDDEKITLLYRQVYIKKPELLDELQKIEAEITKVKSKIALYSDFNYLELLAKYDINAINTSFIKYYQAIQQWINELSKKLEGYEENQKDFIQSFNVISLKLSKKYNASDKLTDEENSLLKNRQIFFNKKLSLDVNNVKTKLLSIKAQADDIENRLNDINDSETPLQGLAVLENETRPSFALVAENTAKILKDFLLKIEFFEEHHDFVQNAVNTLEAWTNDYKVFKTTYKENFIHNCIDGGAEEEIATKWFNDWQTLRFTVEKKVQPLIVQGLKKDIILNDESEISVIEEILKSLDKYKKAIDNFYKEERLNIYQDVTMNFGSELQEKFKVESKLYPITADFQKDLQRIIFNCKYAEDRIFILKWAKDLLDLPIDNILNYMSDNDINAISEDILTSFIALKQKNYETYLNHAEAYDKAQQERQKQYTSLIFKMTKDLQKSKSNQ